MKISMNEFSKWDKFRATAEEFQRKRIERLRQTKDLLPPWAELPEIPLGSIGWRMGKGEEYLGDWFCWLQALSLPERTAYQVRHPEPNSWHGIYANCFQKDNGGLEQRSWNEYWDNEIEKQKEITERQIKIAQQFEKG
jgi:hypothetical protein